MGFRVKKLTFTYGSADFPTGATSEDILAREQYIVKTVAQTIIDFNNGWILDSTKCSSVTDFQPLPDAYYNASRNTALFLKNINSGCKLLIGYIIGTPAKGLDVSGDCYVNTYNSYYSSQSGSVAGLIFSIIPGGSNDVFGTTALDLIPSTATRVTGTVTTSYNSSDTLTTMASNNGTSGSSKYYIILATNSVIGILLYDVDRNLWPRCFCGKIFGAVVDSGVRSEFGTVSFKIVESTNEFAQHYPNASDSARYGTFRSFPNSLTISSKANYTCGGNSLCKADGTWVSNSVNAGCCLYALDQWMTTTTQIHNGTNSRRWAPFYMFVISSDLTTYGVVEGDGVKGILDTDLFRSVPSPGFNVYYYDNKNFIAINESLLLGWDPNNEDITASV